MKRTDYNKAEREMVDYLLGEMPEREREQFAARYFADDALFEQLTVLKEELFDAYARNQLDAPTRALLEQQFLPNPEGQQEVAFAQALRESLNEMPAPLSTPVPAPPLAAVPFQHAAWWSGWTRWHWGWAAITACLLIGLIWQGLENRQLRHTLLTLQDRQTEQLKLAQTLQDELQKLRASTNPPTNPPLPQPSIAPPVTPRSFGESVVSLRLPPPERGQNGTLEARMPANAQTLALQIVLDYAPAARSCKAVLRTADGKPIARQSGLSARPDPLGGLLTWRIAARQLEPGDYKIQVTGRDLDQGDNLTLTYQFRVVRR